MKSAKGAFCGQRLLCASRLVRDGAYFADIGTDHAYLPILLLREGRIDRAVCTDINAGPLDSARRNVAAGGFSASVSFMLTDGAEALCGMGITDYAICGMGGELIADIIDRAPHLAAVGTRLILQPMSRQAVLRRYLASHGFVTVCEEYVSDGGKYYLCLAAEYSGEKREISDIEAEFGSIDDCDILTDDAIGYMRTRFRALKRASMGKCCGGETESTEGRLLSELSRHKKLYERLNAYDG